MSRRIWSPAPPALFWGLAFICAVLHVAQAARAEVRKDRTVVLISLDGFPADALDDPRLPVPTLRRLVREGVFAASMRPVNPTVTWPNHTSLITGVEPAEHHVLFNGWLTFSGGQPSIEPWRDKELLVKAPTLYDLAYQAGLTTAQVDWVAIYRAKTITWQFPEIPDPEGPIEKEMIADGLVTAGQLRTFEDSSQAWQDEMWTLAAEKILEKHRPNLLLLHLLTLDDINHEYGPMSPASFTAMALLDARVSQVLDSLRRAGLAGRSTIVIVSDHGFRVVKHRIHPNVLLREKGLLSLSPGDAIVVPEGGSAMVYVTHADRRSQLIPQLRQLFQGREGIDRVYGEEEFSRLGLPTRAVSDQAPDLVLTATPDYMFSKESDGDFVTPATGGTHGFINTDAKMQSIFIAWGAGIRRGVRLDTISNLDVAPTLAALLGLELKSAKGRAIAAITTHKTQDRRIHR